MQTTSEKHGYLAELSCKDKSLKEKLFCFSQNQDSRLFSSQKLDLICFLSHSLFLLPGEKVVMWMCACVCVFVYMCLCVFVYMCLCVRERKEGKKYKK